MSPKSKENTERMLQAQWLQYPIMREVRCKNCEYYREDREINCVFHLSSVKEDWFCSEGK